jgi:hypothetical protein
VPDSDDADGATHSVELYRYTDGDGLLLAEVRPGTVHTCVTVKRMLVHAGSDVAVQDVDERTVSAEQPAGTYAEDKDDDGDTTVSACTSHEDRTQALDTPGVHDILTS